MFKNSLIVFVALASVKALPVLADSAADSYRKGYASLSANRYTEAAAFFKDATRTTNATAAAAAWLGQGEAFYNAKQWEAAIAAYDALLKGYPQSQHAARALYARGLAEFQAGRLSTALTNLSLFVEHYPKHPLASTAIASTGTLSRTLAAQVKQREYEMMARDLAQINALSHDVKAAETATAVRLFLQAHPDHPQSATLRYLAANCALRAKDYALAVSAYRDFLAHHPQHAQNRQARLELGQSLSAQGLFGEAADIYATASGTDAQFLCADSLVKAKRLDEALKLYQTLANHSPDAGKAAQVTLAMGDCYAALKKWSEAERAFLSVQASQTADALCPIALDHLASLYDNIGQTDNAAIVRQELKRRFPN